MIALFDVLVLGFGFFLFIFFCIRVNKNTKIKRNYEQINEHIWILRDDIPKSINFNKDIDENNTDKGKNDKDLNEYIEFKTFEEKPFKISKELYFLMREP